MLFRLLTCLVFFVLAPATLQATSTTRPSSRATTHPTSLPSQRFYARELLELKKLATQTRSPEEKAILRGLHWVTSFVEPDKVFEWIFCEYLFILKTVHIHRQGTALGRILSRLGHKSAKRVFAKRHGLYQKTLDDKWEFLNVLPMLSRYKIPQKQLLMFYKQHFPAALSPPRKTTWKQARQKSDMAVMGDYLIESSFLHFFLKKYPSWRKHLPRDLFPQYLQDLRGVRYRFRFSKNKLDYSTQNYFLTHVNAVLTNYGEFPQPVTPVTRQLWKYWEREWKTIRYKVRDFDLLAEVLFCYKLYGKARTPKIQKAFQYLLKQQNPTGSWGSKKTLAGGYYEAIHPTWTAITALVTPHGQVVPTSAPTTQQNTGR